MNKEQILLKIKNLEKEITELNEMIKEENKGRWIPQVNEEYFCVRDGEAESWVNSNSRYDYDIINIQKVFKTKEEAEFEIERQKTLRKMEEFEYHFTKEEWENVNIWKYYIWFDFNYKKIGVDCACLKRNDIYFKSKEDIQACIDAIGEDNLIKYYFNIKED